MRPAMLCWRPCAAKWWQFPNRKRSPSPSLNRSLSSGIDPVLMTALAPRPDDRFTNIGAVMNALYWALG